MKELRERPWLLIMTNIHVNQDNTGIHQLITHLINKAPKKLDHH